MRGERPSRPGAVTGARRPDRPDAIRQEPGLLALQRQIGNRAAVAHLAAPAPETIQRAPSVKDRMAALAQSGLSDPEADRALQEKQVREQEEALTAAAFRSSTFYYGTTGGTGILKTFITTLAERKKSGRAKLEFYWPGERAGAYIADQSGRGPESPGGTPSPAHGESAQMMDMYYGQPGTELHERRNPQIGKYVHEKMGYEGDYDQHKSGRDSYMET